MQILKMDFQSQSAPPVVPVMQSDAQSRFVGIALYNGGTPYEAPEGAVYTVQYRGEGANNFGWYDNILTASGKHAAVTVDADSTHIVTLELAEQALRRSGDVHVNLCVLCPDAGYELRTFDFIARVSKAAYPDEVAVQSFFFVTGVSSVSWLNYVSTCMEAQEAAEKAVKLAEDSADTAKNAAVSAEKDAKAAQDSANASRDAANQIKFIANGCLGYYSTAQALRTAYPTADAGSWAIVAENSTIWVWNPSTSAWKDSSVNVDFSAYYSKTESDARFALTADKITAALGYDPGDKITRLERMMNMDGKLVFSGAGVCTGGTTTMAIPSTVDYVEIVSAIPALGRAGYGGTANSGYSISVGNSVGVSEDFGHARVARGGSATVAFTGLSTRDYSPTASVRSTSEFTDIALVSVSFASGGTLSISGGSSANRFTVYGYQYL